jgi:glucan phosphoethanolaminetransferase (alkaline phosphatase superfamily)
MWFRGSTKRKDEEQEPAAAKRRADREPTIDQGVYYLYMIIGLQILFVFVLMAVIMFIGKVISTPGWVFLIIFVLFAASMIYIYRKAKKQFRKIKESFSKADRNYEISIMGGMLTMRIEQNPNAPKLLEAPISVSDEPVIDAETTEPDPAARKPAHLS